MIKWQDAYLTQKAMLKDIISNLGNDCVCKTEGKVVYHTKRFTVLQQHISTEGLGDYFVIPNALIIRKTRRGRKVRR